MTHLRIVFPFAYNDNSQTDTTAPTTPPPGSTQSTLDAALQDDKKQSAALPASP
jgi:hypothetical protein